MGQNRQFMLQQVGPAHIHMAQPRKLARRRQRHSKGNHLTLLQSPALSLAQPRRSAGPRTQLGGLLPEYLNLNFPLNQRQL